MEFLKKHLRNNIPTIGKLGQLEDKDVQRFIDKLESDTLSKENCWIWRGVIQDKKNKGHQHGIFWFNGNNVQAHRIIFHNVIANVPEYIPSGFILLHKCPTDSDGRCVNPWHLQLGTPKENTKDAKIADTLHMIGDNESNHMSKLSNEQIQEIIALKNTGISQRQVAKKYHINQSQISRYWNNKTRIQI